MKNKNWQEQRREQLKELIKEYSSKLTATEIFDILFIGHYIYKSGVGLIFEEVVEILEKEMNQKLSSKYYLK